jgi:hypothetical protein
MKPMNTPPYRIAHSTFNGETLWAVEKIDPATQDYGIVKIFTSKSKAQEHLSTLQ